jgi:membrane protein implicated in regulation of membrane protease activity
MFLLAALVSLVVLPSPWNALGFVVCLVLFGGEVVFWHRTVRERRAKAGAETLVGQTASVVAACRPEGQVRLAGELWGARSREGAERGETVVVIGRDGLTLLVERSA